VENVRQCARTKDAKGIWRGLRRLQRGGGHAAAHAKPSALQTPEGVLVMDDQRIANGLAEHYQRVCDPAVFAQGADFDDQHHATVEAAVHDIRSTLSHTDAGATQLNNLFTDMEVTQAALRLRNHKAPSPLDGINNELLKYGGGALHAALAAFFNLQWSMETKAQTHGVIRSLHKRGDETVANNYRPITLGATVDKLYNAAINARIVAHLESTGGLHDAQQGFRAGRNALDNIFMLATTLQGRLRRKLSTFVLFLDIEKAYDSVWRAGLLWHVWQAGIRGRMFRVLAQMCDAPASVVEHNGCLSQQFRPGMGWEQGDPLATTMFNIHINTVLNAVWQQHPGVPIGPPQPHAVAQEGLVALMFADDLAGLADSPERLQALINTVHAELRRWRIKASVSPADASKTAVMAVRPAPHRNPVMHEWHWGAGGTRLPVVRSYKYLGVHLCEDGSWDAHIAARLEKATNAAKAHHTVLHSAQLPWGVRKTALVAAVLPVAHYAAAIWNRSTCVARRMLDSWQMGVVTGMVHCPPTTSHACLQQELGIQPLHITCDEQTLNYWHRLRTLPADRLVAKVAAAWTGVAAPWAQHVSKLLAQYGIDTDATKTHTKEQFKQLVKQQAAQRVQQLWAARANGGSRVLQRYNEHYASADASSEGEAQPYWAALCSAGRGKAATLCLRLRIECLQLRGTCRRQPRESATAHKQRQLCPCCMLHPETPEHFALHCSAHQEHRHALLSQLRTAAPHAMQVFDTLTAAKQLHALLSFDHGILGRDQVAEAPEGGATTAGDPAWGVQGRGGLGSGGTGCIADFLLLAWKRRCSMLACSALNGRGTQGGDSVV